MSESMPLDRLLRLMPPHEGAGEDVDWEATESEWGTRFPTDYKRFMALYGVGDIEGYLVIDSPVPSPGVPPDETMEAETARARRVWAKKPPIDLGSGPASLIAWGTDASGDMLCWITSAADPDMWPVVVWNRGDASWDVYQCGMVEFLCRVFHAEFEENPPSDMGLWGNASPRFLTQIEQQRIWASGVDPWFDEGDYRDVFNDMFGRNS